MSASSAGTHPPDGPPTCTAFSVRPSGRPPPILSTISLSVIPIGTSIRPPCSIFPASANAFVPLLASVPSAANDFAPFLTIHGTDANVSTLLISVGLPRKPCSEGYGGRSLGIARRPSIAAINAVSSPHTNAPAPSTTLSLNEKPDPMTLSPIIPLASHSAKASLTRAAASGYSART